MGSALRLRSVALLLAGAYAVHALRWALAGAAATGGGRPQGHGYLGAAPIALTALLAVAVAELALRVAWGRGTGGGPRGSLGRLWAVCAGALVLLFVAQELAEGWLVAGRPQSPAPVLAHGGWLAGPLSAGVGLVVALAQRGAAVALAAVPLAAPRPRARPAVGRLGWFRAGVRALLAPSPWLGGRGPPAPAG